LSNVVVLSNKKWIFAIIFAHLFSDCTQ
jgi:hypothetical protein